MSKRIAFVLSLLLTLPAISVASAAPPGVHFSSPGYTPTSSGPNDQVTLTITVTSGAGIHNVTVHYTTNNWKPMNTTVLASYNSTNSRATAQIPAQYNGGNVQYYYQAFDNNNNEGTFPNAGYLNYTVPAPAGITTSTWIELAIVFVVIAAAASIALYSFRSKPTAH